MYSLNCSDTNVVIHKVMLICNLSVAVTPYNRQMVTFYSLLNYKMFNVTCDSILKYTDMRY